MTVVAFDGKIMAADSMLRMGAMIASVKKVHRVGDRLVGWCGTAHHAMLLVDWLLLGAVPGAFPKQPEGDDAPQLMIASREGISILDTVPMELKISQTAWAIGGGAEFALGAMARGATAVEAVEIAIRLSALCAGPVQWEAL